MNRERICSRSPGRGAARLFAALFAAVPAVSAAGEGIQPEPGPPRPRYWQSTEAEDYRIKRKEVFEFAKKPAIERDGDRVTIRFASKDFCDATVVVEKKDGTILRHLASGVLGPRAPEPFQPDSLEQTVIWDGKDDLGKYVDALDDVHVRVSLGLKARFEKTLFWHPKKELGRGAHLHMAAQPEGVYVYTGGGVETIRLFGHDGRYIRTVYPFPADKVKDVKGLGWNTFADGWKSPAHIGYTCASFLPSGAGEVHASWGTAARSMAVGAGRIVLPPCVETKSPDNRFARLSTDGRPLECSLYGPPLNTDGFFPLSMAFSPDGQWLYMAGFVKLGSPLAIAGSLGSVSWRHGVCRMRFDSDEPPQLWLGDWEKFGKDGKSFDHPAGVAVDAQGRVYVADNHNDRVQIFSPDGKLLRSIPVNGPAVLQIHHKTQELYVFSWNVSVFWHVPPSTKPHPVGVSPRLRVFKPFESDQPSLTVPLPLHADNIRSLYYQNIHSEPIPFRAMLNSYADPPEIWMVTGWAKANFYNPQDRESAISNWLNENIQRYRIEDGKLKLVASWNEEVEAAVKKWKHSDMGMQRLLTDPRDGTLYVMDSTYKYASSLVRIRPDSGEVDIVPMPYTFEDAAIDWEGHVLLRWDRAIGRFALDSLREVPFDYGEEIRRVCGFNNYKDGGSLISGLVLPGNRASCGYDCGMGVNARGEIAVSACNSAVAESRDGPVYPGMPRYVPQIFPGRVRYHEIHIFDRHGKPVGMDIVGRGAPPGHGVSIDQKGDVYFLTTQSRLYDGRAFFPETGTAIKFKRGKGRFIAAGSTGPSIPLPDDQRPNVSPQLLTAGGRGSAFWVEDAEWMFPGVGRGRNLNCYCWNARFTVDAFGRSFLPQFIRCQVAVLDTNGNLIMQIGRYGNVDDGEPLVEDQRFRTEKPRSIGGDEVALMYANYTGTHHDRRLFIADAGNGRILSVRLDYHASERVPVRAAKGP
ncbi:MAG: hypothetical protein N3A38_09340 [Planctomycetota bacterium]|nr:hypothetical protein [Planctomycetota bacterium]